MKTTITVDIDHFIRPKDDDTWTAHGGTFQTIGGFALLGEKQVYLFNNCNVENTDQRFADLAALDGLVAQLFVLDEDKLTGSGKPKYKILGFPNGPGDDSEGLQVVDTGSTGAANGSTGAGTSPTPNHDVDVDAVGKPAPISSDLDQAVDEAVAALRNVATFLLGLKGSDDGKQAEEAAPSSEQPSEGVSVQGDVGEGTTGRAPSEIFGLLDEMFPGQPNKQGALLKAELKRVGCAPVAYPSYVAAVESLTPDQEALVVDGLMGAAARMQEGANV